MTGLRQPCFISLALQEDRHKSFGKEAAIIKLATVGLEDRLKWDVLTPHITREVETLKEELEDIACDLDNATQR